MQRLISHEAAWLSRKLISNYNLSLPPDTFLICMTKSNGSITGSRVAQTLGFVQPDWLQPILGSPSGDALHPWDRAESESMLAERVTCPKPQIKKTPAWWDVYKLSLVLDGTCGVFLEDHLSWSTVMYSGVHTGPYQHE